MKNIDKIAKADLKASMLGMRIVHYEETVIEYIYEETTKSKLLTKKKTVQTFVHEDHVNDMINTIIANITGGKLFK